MKRIWPKKEHSPLQLVCFNRCSVKRGLRKKIPPPNHRNHTENCHTICHRYDSLGAFFVNTGTELVSACCVGSCWPEAHQNREHKIFRCCLYSTVFFGYRVVLLKSKLILSSFRRKGNISKSAKMLHLYIFEVVFYVRGEFAGSSRGTSARRVSLSGTNLSLRQVEDKSIFLAHFSLILSGSHVFLVRIFLCTKSR